MTDRPRLQERRQFERPHVLVVSDDPSLVSFLEEGLPLGGFWVSIIASGIQALEVFRLRQFDLVTLDWSLQSFDAMEFLRRLRGVSTRATGAEARTSAPVVVISEHPVELSDADSEHLAVDRTLHAPLEIEDVVRKLHAVFEQWREAHPDARLSDDPLRDNF